MFRVLVITALVALVSGRRIFPIGLKPISNSIKHHRIVGGHDADKSIPYQVSIMYYGAHHCGGSIINSRIILTAAHCLFGFNPRLIKVRVGSKFRSSQGTLFSVKDLQIHENFDFTTMDNDVAVIYLEKNIKMQNGVIEPIEMAKFKSEVAVGTRALVSGWGILEENGPSPEILQVAILPIIEHDKCNQLMSNLITDRMICAGYIEGGVDACQQDSGGPLMVGNVLIGVVSWGDGCAKPERPGIFVKVSEMRNWIDDSIAKLTKTRRYFHE